MMYSNTERNFPLDTTMRLLSNYKPRVSVPPYYHQARYRTSNEGKNVNVTLFLVRAHLPIFTIVNFVYLLSL
jgi:hypothetical protein